MATPVATTCAALMAAAHLGHGQEFLKADAAILISVHARQHPIKIWLTAPRVKTARPFASGPALR
ncbi:MAG: hypothetical protein O2824_05310 [Proteobacteria bacterium]|nr:hypothetical protein [Pseudomonadota bacterium]